MGLVGERRNTESNTGIKARKWEVRTIKGNCWDWLEKEEILNQIQELKQESRK